VEQMRALAARVRERIDELGEQKEALEKTLVELLQIEREALERVDAAQG
jgi:hypothetical protein